MPAGTIALTNNSTAVTGSGTNFSSELKANDFLVAIVGGVTYTLGVQSVNSATSVTLTTAYNGPTTSGLAWTAVPNAALVGITAQVAADVAKAIRGLNLDKANWQQVYSTAGNITVTLPDGTQYSGPSWKSLATSLSGLGDSATRNVGTTSGTVAAGNDSRLNTVNGKTGGAISSSVQVSAGTLGCNGPIVATGSGFFCDNVSDTTTDATSTFMRAYGLDRNYDVYHQYYLVKGQYHSWRSVQNAVVSLSVRSNGACYAASFNPTSDSRLKFNKRFIGDALSKSMTLRGMTYQIQGEARAGVIAQDVQRVLPESVTVDGEEIVLEDGEIINDQLSLDYAGITALNTEALKDVVKLMLECLTDPDSAKSKLINLVDSINASTDDANETDMKMEWALLNPPVSSPDEVTEDNPSEGEA
ncbi:hypothetical protein ABIB18_001883 [Pantoea sp. UYEF8]